MVFRISSSSLPATASQVNKVLLKTKNIRVLLLKKMKRQKKSDNSDRLSDLPDHLLLLIMEFLDPKHSIQTCVLSKRWKDLWKSLTMFTFYHARDRKFVSHILSGRDDSLSIRMLKYYYLNTKGNLDLKTNLLEVMKYGASHNVKILMVCVNPCRIKDLELPPSIFHCHSLTSLRLHFGHPASHYVKILFPKSLNLPALKTLYLGFLTFTTSENGFAEPFSTCNMLKTLFIFSCRLQDDAKALCISNSNVSNLVIGDICKHARGSYSDVVFCTPKLTFLTIRGFLGFVSPSVCNLPFLEIADIEFVYLPHPFLKSFLTDLLHLVANVETIIITFRTLGWIYTFQKKFPTHRIVPCFVRLKSLRVDWISDTQIFNAKVRRKVTEMVTCLLQNSLHAKVDIILKSGSTYRKLED